MSELLLDWEFDAAMLALGSPDVEVSIKASLRLKAHDAAQREQLEDSHSVIKTLGGEKGILLEQLERTQATVDSLREALEMLYDIYTMGMSALDAKWGKAISGRAPFEIVRKALTSAIPTEESKEKNGE